jgi:hypothetical protein
MDIAAILCMERNIDGVLPMVEDQDTPNAFLFLF